MAATTNSVPSSSNDLGFPNQPSSSSSKDGPRTCKDCKITFPNIYDYADHLESKEHKKGVMKNKYGVKYLEAKANLLDSSSVKPLERESEKSGSSDNEEVYTCEICEKVCTGILNYKLHLSGKKHKKNIKKSETLKQLKMNKIVPDDVNSDEDDSLMNAIFTKNEFASSEILCKICNKKCPGPEAFKQHNESEGHRKKLAIQDLLKALPRKTTAESSESDDSASVSCDICNKVFSGPLPYKQHMQSSFHLKQVKEIEKTAKFKDLMISSEDRRKLQCKECNKFFSGPKPFRDHLKSSLHSKLKQKNEILKMIQQNHPEMIIASNLNISDEDGSDDNTILCTVCHTAFTGPESVRDHLESQKHKKGMKKKTRIEKFKLLKHGKQPEVVSKSKLDSDKISNNDDHINELSDNDIF